MSRVRRNRSLELSLKDVLDLAAWESYSRHPHDFIDKDSAIINLKRSPEGWKLVIKWDGYPTDADDYGESPQG